MKKLRYVTAALFLLFQSSQCVARDGSFANISVAPDPSTGCHQYRADYAVAERSTLGLMLAYDCANRPSRPLNGSMDMSNGVSNTFNRVLVPWRYAPRGALRDGYFVDAMVGLERAEYRTTAGSTANVHFFDVALGLGYQWFWHNGLNVSVFAGAAHLMRQSGGTNISATESAGASDYLKQQTSSNSHLASGAYVGWSF
ncbi:MAG: hypothetical protein Q8L92_02100 [Rubrivivax sp.]|nr:hypothetical protein [Rubrivivax sp.]